MHWKATALAIVLACGYAGVSHADELTQIVQQDLTALGYDTGGVDGNPGTKTVIAVSRFQAEHGLEVTGEITPQLAGRIKAAMSQGGSAGQAQPAAASPAQAQADINISTPSINKLKQAMSSRFQQLQPAFNSGAVGLTNDGLIALRDPNALGLKERGQAQQLVKQENSDRSALYREIAKANGHPEWERDIRNTFAKQWIKNARGGWWYQDDSGSWRQR